jgi:hypothetical protein
LQRREGREGGAWAWHIYIRIYLIFQTFL